MVRYTIPASILAMAAGSMGSDTHALVNKGSILSSDGGSASGQQVSDTLKVAMKNLKGRLGKSGKAGKAGKGKSKGEGNGGSDRNRAPAETPRGPGDVSINGVVMALPFGDQLEPIDLSDAPATEDNGRTGPAISNSCAGSIFSRGAEGFEYADGAEAVNEKDPKPRVISNAFGKDESIPNSIRASDWLWQWGQFVDHDYALGEETGPELRIDIPVGDPDYPADQDHFETERTMAEMDNFGVAQQVNDLSSHINAGNVYGDTTFRFEFLKANDGTGRMKTSANNMLPVAGDDEMVQGLTARFADSANTVDQPISEYFVAGDARVNEHLGLIAVHTLLMREHNYWADMIRDENPELTGNEVFDSARVIVQSEVQRITYDEFLPLIIGDVIPEYTGYDPEVNGAALNVGASCAYRVGHTLISPSIAFQGPDDDAPSFIPFEETFWNPEVIRAEGLDPFMRGMSNTVCQELDAHISPVLRNNLFNVNEGSAPRDLYALNIERAREHGIPNYNQLRAAYLGGNTQLADNTDCFLNEDIFQPEAGAILASLYDGPGSADCFPALLSEVHVPGAMVGETQQAILRQQFTDLRDSDPFWYENRLEGPILDMVKNTGLADIIKRNADTPGALDDIPDNAFIVPGPAGTPLEPNSGNGNGNGNAHQNTLCDASFSAPSAGFSAVYTMTNQPNNEVLVYSRDTSTGLLTFEQAVSTGGIGGGLDVGTGPGGFSLPVGADPFGSSDGIRVAGKCLLVCNSASHEVTSFRIKSASEIEPNAPVSTGGTWPISIAERDGLVYVMNGGGNGSVQGFNLNPGNCNLAPVGVPVDIPQGGGPLDPDGAFPNDPPSILAKPAQIGFTPSGDVIVVVAADGGGQNAAAGPLSPDNFDAFGTINVFHVQPDGTVVDPVVTRIDQAARFPLAFDHDPQGRLLVAEISAPGPGGVSVWEYGSDGSVSEIQTGLSVLEPLTCWIKYDAKNGCSYTTNTSPDGSISTVFSGEDGVTLVEHRAAELVAPIDITISGDGNHVYTLTNQSTNAGGTGQPLIYVHSTSCDCSMEELQLVTDGLPTEAARIAADGVFEGIVGIATYPN